MKLISVITGYLLAIPAGAQTLVWDIALKIETAPNDWAGRFLGKTFPGVIRVDSSRLLGVGEEQLGFDEFDPAFTLSLTFDEGIYSASDDPAAGLPILYFSDGELMELDFAVYLSAPPYGEGSYFQLHPDGLLNYSPDGVGEYEGSYLISSSSIPEVSITSFALIFLSLTLISRKR